MNDLVIPYRNLGLSDIHLVGGKNASLGELIGNLASAGVNVPNGFATTADAYRDFLKQNALNDQIEKFLEPLDPTDVAALAQTGAAIRTLIEEAPFPHELEDAVREAYGVIATGDTSWAVRSSATAEDLPDASFAGQQETFLNVSGIDQILHRIKQVYASLYNDRAIAYRTHHGFPHQAVAISAGIQRMVRSDLGSSGVMFTMDTESGFDDAIFITASYGLGEAVVQGAVNPDEFYVYKPGIRNNRPAVLSRRLGEKAVKMVYAPAGSDELVQYQEINLEARNRFSLTDDDLAELARQALIIENHYARPMDIEWGKDGLDGGIYILQARPETVLSRQSTASHTTFSLSQKGNVLLEGRSIGERIGAGKVRILRSLDDMTGFESGDILVADMTDPDWEPVMAKAAAIVTNRGGRTCHAAIIAREMGIPAVVGTGQATTVLEPGQPITVSCAEGSVGYVYKEMLRFDRETIEIDLDQPPPVKVMMNIAAPEQAFSLSRLPNHGVGLARLEFIINRQIGIHPLALLDPDSQEPDVIAEIQRRVTAYDTPRAFYVKRLAEGIATIAAAFAPNPVIVRTSDFKSNEYANLIGGPKYEPEEENPMLGFRGALRYLDPAFRPCFEMECEAIRHVRDEMGLSNLKVMIPFVRTPGEGAAVVDLLAENGLVRGQNGLEVYMMCELPVNAILAEQFLESFDGFSIGSNDLTQLTLGLDRDSGLVSAHFDERNEAVRYLMYRAIEACRNQGKYVGICGQGPSDHPDLAEWLLLQGISSVSLNPDTVVPTWQSLLNA